MSPQRVIRSGARRSTSPVRSLPWLAAAAALPVVVIVLVLTAVTLTALIFTPDGVGQLFPIVAVEWFVLTHVPLAVDTVELGFLPLLPVLVYIAVLARQTRSALDDVEDPGAPDVAAAVLGPTLVATALTGLGVVLVGSAASDFAIRERSLPEALAWTAVVTALGAGLGSWFHRRRALREHLPDWFRGGLHLGTAYLAAACAIASLLVLVGLASAWTPVADSLGLGKGLWGYLSLAAISIGYLPNVVFAGATVVLGGEAHLGEASYSLFAVNRGPMPEIPLAHALPTSSPHWAYQGVLLASVVATAVLARAVAHWFGTIGDGVKAAWTAAVVAALGVAVTPLLAGGTLGVLGTVGTGALIASGVALLLFGVIGSITVALSLAGLTRRRQREFTEIERRRRRLARVEGRDPDAVAPDAGILADDAVDDGAQHHGTPDEDGDAADDDATGDLPADDVTVDARERDTRGAAPDDTEEPVDNGAEPVAPSRPATDEDGPVSSAPESVGGSESAASDDTGATEDSGETSEDRGDRGADGPVSGSTRAD